MPSSLAALFIVIILVTPRCLTGQVPKLPPLEAFISDTLSIVVPFDSTMSNQPVSIQVIDSRKLGESTVGIKQIKKWKYIPVDQYLELNQSLATLFQTQFASDSLQMAGTLHITDLILWTDRKPFFSKGLCLNAYTTFHDTTGNPVSDWIWEIRLKKKKKQAEDEYLGQVIRNLITAQSTALSSSDFNLEFYPHLYRRQMMIWNDFIIFKDGFGVNAHLTLDFPADQKSKWVRGSPGIFYRKASDHESIAIGGKDQIWFWRLSSNWIAKSSGTYRFGFNNFERSHYSSLDFWNLFYVNLSSMASLEYRPVYHKGLFGGIGLYQGVNILPDVIDQFETGLVLNLGILLP